MTKTLVFGHKNPDTDTICSAISYAELKKAQGADIEAVRLGELNSETAFVLDYFQVTAPRLVQTVANEVSEVALVDHNERQQSVDDIDDVTVTAVVDHHRIANFETSDPLYYRAEPVGCTTTILLKMFRENEVEVSKTVRSNAFRNYFRHTSFSIANVHARRQSSCSKIGADCRC